MDNETLALLQAEKPSQRSLAIDRLRREAAPVDIRRLRAAMQAETVPMLRRQLSELVRELSRPASPPESTALPVQRSAADKRRYEEDFVHWMRHELEPGIGWLMLAASDEIEDFDNSETRAAIESINMRIDSVEALVRASAPPRFEMLSLSEVVLAAVQTSGAPEPRLSIDLPSEASDNIATDANLMRLVVSNAVRNAVDAVLETRGNDAQVYVTAGVTPDTFWVKISNQFVGAEFSLDDVSGTGVSAKIGHQGQGFAIMRIAAKRLGYELLMQADAGLAIFTLRGNRNSE